MLPLLLLRLLIATAFCLHGSLSPVACLFAVCTLSLSDCVALSHVAV